MRIECAWNDGVPFKNLNPGDCFMLDGRILMKVVLLTTSDELENAVEYNAIDLVKGFWYGICDVESVIPIDGKFVVDP